MLRLINYDEVSSTNELVKRAIEAGEPEGYAVRARRQTGGYGRQGRAWSSPEGGLYLSILLRPDVSSVQLPTLSLVAALAVRRALAEALPCVVRNIGDAGNASDASGASNASGASDASGARDAHPQPGEASGPGNASDISGARGVGVAGEAGDADSEDDTSWRNPILVKWPNDLVVVGGSLCVAKPCESAISLFRKLCGISIEAHAGGVCVGIGVNVFKSADAGTSVAFGKNVPAYLEELGFCGTLDELATGILDEFEQTYKQWLGEGFSCFRIEYDQYAALAGSHVSLLDRDGSAMAEGRVEGIDEAGRLLLRKSDDSLFAANSGEVHIT